MGEDNNEHALQLHRTLSAYDPCATMDTQKKFAYSFSKDGVERQCPIEIRPGIANIFTQLRKNHLIYEYVDKDSTVPKIYNSLVTHLHRCICVARCDLLRFWLSSRLWRTAILVIRKSVTMTKILAPAHELSTMIRNKNPHQTADV